jgi:phosphoribosylaminoimidazole-succinocarboxamide synthase
MSFMESQLIRAIPKSPGKPHSGGVFELRGKSKDFRGTARPGILLQQFKEESLQGPSRADLASELSSYLFGYLHGYNIPTHFLSNEGGGTMLVRRMEMYPLCLRIWNTAGAVLSRRLGFREGADLSFPVMEHYYKRGDAPYPLVNEFHLFSLGVVTPEELRTINRLASKTNAVLRSLFVRRGLKLYSLVLEFGNVDGQIALGDELTPRTCMAGEVQSRSRRARDAAQGSGTPSLEAYTLMRDRLIGEPAGAVQP